jgi:hypothetical protein
MPKAFLKSVKKSFKVVLVFVFLVKQCGRSKFAVYYAFSLDLKLILFVKACLESVVCFSFVLD